MQDLLAAACLVLVIEGLLPFANPRGWRAALARIAELNDRTIRIAGGISMLIGIVLLQFVRG